MALKFDICMGVVVFATIGRMNRLQKTPKNRPRSVRVRARWTLFIIPAMALL
jgi:hypothetical protein